MFLHGNEELWLESDKTVITSENDNLLTCFSGEYDRLLSHRRTVDGIDPEGLVKAIVKRRNYREEFEKCDAILRDMTEIIIRNMCQRFGYSPQIALDTIVFAIRKDIVNFSELIS